MKKISFVSSISFAFLSFFVSGTILAQTPTPKPPLDNEKEVVKIATNLIQVDITVKDKKGNKVTDIKPEEIEIYENGERKQISNFSYVSSKTEKSIEETTISNNEKKSSISTTTPIKPEQVRRTISIVIDDLNISFSGIYYVKRALRDFVDKQMQPNDLVAIIRASSGIGVLQQFTSDKQILYAAIEKIRWYPLGNDNIDGVRPIETTAQDVTERTVNDANRIASAGSGSSYVELRNSRGFNPGQTEADLTRRFNEFRGSIYSVGTIGTVNYTLNGMKDLPGRKILMLFSDGIQIFSRQKGLYAESVRENLKKLIDFAKSESIIIYTFDTKGLRSLAFDASESSVELHEQKLTQKLAQRASEFYDSQEGLTYLADGTGGEHLINSNDLNFGIKRVLDQQGYYLIGYQPEAENFDKEKYQLSKLTVKVSRPNVEVNYHTNFFETPGKTNQSGNLTSKQKITQALTSPFSSNEIALNMNASFANDAKDGAYIRSFLHIEAKDLKFTTDKDGWQKAVFDVVAVAFGDDGVPVEQTGKAQTIKAKGETFRAMVEEGFIYTLIFPVKTSGNYQLRVVIRDTDSNKIGSASQIIRIPNLKKQELTLSGLVLEDFTFARWQNLRQGKSSETNTPTNGAETFSTLLYDTTLRKFARNTVLQYGLEIYNAKPDKNKKPQLQTQAKILYQGKPVIEGKLNDLDTDGQPDLQSIKVSGAIALKSELPAGDYVLQLTVTDSVNKKTETQWIDFELTDEKK